MRTLRDRWLVALLASLLFGCGGPARPSEQRAAGEGRCSLDGERLSCPHRTFTLEVPTVITTFRDVHIALPEGTPPTSGWPAVILFQGSFFSAEQTWSADPSEPFGAIHQTRLVEALLASGFAVIAPEAQYDGHGFWDTNTVAWAHNWEAAPDHLFMLQLFSRLAAGDFGPVDARHLHASGISSGGYMTSRMALSYPGRFQSLAIQSASWATCSGPLCALPESLPTDHPPTLFLHGDKDAIVPVSTMKPYASQLEAEGHAVKVVEDSEAGHEWLESAPEEIVSWFLGFG